MTKIIAITLQNKEQLLYTSIAAALKDPKNPIEITARRWSQIVKSGYPFDYEGCKVELKWAKGTSDIL